MPKQSIPFTETYLKRLPIPESGDDSYNDRGLRLRVYPSVAKKWSLWPRSSIATLSVISPNNNVIPWKS
jgi:hypothetical protein